MTTAEWIAAEGYDDTLRVWAMSGPNVLAAAQGPRTTPLTDIAGGWLGDGVTPVVIADMLAADRPVPCVPLARMMAVNGDGRMALYPVAGLSQTVPARDVVRDGIARIVGVLQAHPEFDGVICLTGARSVWASISAGEVTDFRTFMTGEMMDLLGRHSSLAPMLTGGAVDAAPFDDALAQALSRPEAVMARLSAVSADPEDARARVAGALIGAELAAAKPWWLGRPVLVVGDGPMAGLYARALRHVGLTPPVVSGVDAGLAGLIAAWRKIKGEGA